MCVIVLKPSGVSIPETSLRQCFTSNNHGCGLMYWTKHGLKIEKGIFKLKTLSSILRDLRNREVAVHFRFATHGLKNRQQTHPFVLSGSFGAAKCSNSMSGLFPAATRALMHNGILHEFGDKRHSDTLDFAVNVLSRINTTANCTALLSSLPGRYCLAADGELHTVGLFEELAGCFYSNLYWLGKPEPINEWGVKPTGKLITYDDFDYDAYSNDPMYSHSCYKYLDKP